MCQLIINFWCSLENGAHEDALIGPWGSFFVDTRGVKIHLLFGIKNFQLCLQARP